jgi:sugar transferase (PEP-CTERM system associated)
MNLRQVSSKIEKDIQAARSAALGGKPRLGQAGSKVNFLHNDENANRPTTIQSLDEVGRRFIPRPAVSLFLLDAICNSLAIGGILIGTHLRLGVASVTQAAIVAAFAIVVIETSLYAMGSYRRDALISMVNATGRLPVVIALSTLAIVFSLHFIFPLVFSARVYLSISRCGTIALLASGTATAVLIFGRYAFFALMRRRWFMRHVMVIGNGVRAQHLMSLMKQTHHKSLAHLTPVSESILRPDGRAVTDTRQGPADASKELAQLVAELAIDEIVLAVDNPKALPLESLLACKVLGVPITGYDSFLERETGRVDLKHLDPSYLVFSTGFQIRLADRVAKRVLDIAFSLVLLAICLPVFALAMLAIWIEGGGAIFYRQERVTRGDRVFWLYKLRTMRSDAESGGAKWAAKSDSRITKVGGFLRRTRIDEIPQLINILKGDMSVVGPRPERPVFIDEIGKEVQMFALRHGVKAGLTGWAQINYPYGASITDAARKLEYDLYYMKNYSWLRDISIILQTIRIVILQEGVR